MINIKVEVISNKNNCVEVNTQYGLISGQWNGESPNLNVIKEVEIEIDDTLKWHEDIVKVDVREFKCGSIGKKHLLLAV